jgi:tRNA-2-methylthio-N6-dimethylallyladenosine synthase
MRRFYTADQYLKKIEMVKKFRPDIALSTDIIVGFPGETRKDFEDTLRIVREVEFDNVYSFKYSARPYTRSEKWDDDVSAEEKIERMAELLVLQRQMSSKKYKEDIGHAVEIMLEEPSKTDSNFWTGRTRKNRVVHIPTDDSYRNGKILWAQIETATHSWLRGRPLPDSATQLKVTA